MIELLSFCTAIFRKSFGEGDDHVSPPIQAASLYTNSVPQYAKGGVPMAKVQSDSVYRSETSWEAARGTGTPNSAAGAS